MYFLERQRQAEVESVSGAAPRWSQHQYTAAAPSVYYTLWYFMRRGWSDRAVAATVGGAATADQAVGQGRGLRSAEFLIIIK
jgi:hypothetical protein